ncbi:ABC transporter permease subunit [uncultured Thiothrix sp.]|uniref:ABC transporter permease subunit n=1 Tax=uncultured Thiothrix sp. TaxID=223185 RepID=UPI00262A8503|nr:ABC transporter permease subunit [uncultured Thiothrix sp.]HMT94608.1 ABC transporter permease subunit [Thiolinea sp.]
MLEMLPHWLSDWLGPDGMANLAYITNGKHLSWYASVRYTLIAAAFGAILAVFFGLLGAAAKLSKFAPLRWLGDIYTTMVRGIPDVLFLLFFPLAFEQGVEYMMAQWYCKPDELAAATTWPLCANVQWYLSTTEYMILACVSLGLVYGAFAANVIYGALTAVPKGQLEAAHAFGFPSREVFWRFQVRQMWVYALPGLSNVWLLLLKATSLLSLLQITDIVSWADRLGAPNYSPVAGLVHGDWRWKYYLVLFIFYILLTWLSEKFFAYLQARAGRGMARAN